MHQGTGAQIITHLLERQGVEVVFGIPGGMNLPLYDALGQSTSIRHVLARHEQGAGFMAQGWARATGQAGVCLATSGPGATNVLTALADAKLDSIPVICITGQVPTLLIGTDAFQEVDIYGMSLPVTKHNFLARSAEELFEIIPEAFRIALSGRPGPVLIDVPKDVQTQTLSFPAWPEPGRPDPRPEPDPGLIAEAARRIHASQRPILCLGGGAIQANASAPALRLAEKAGIPVATTLQGLGAIPCDHPLALGMLGMHAARYTNLAMEACDCLIAVGARFGDRATGRVEHFCRQAEIIHIDIDASELDKIKAAHVGIRADAAAALAALLPAVGAADRRAWLAELDRLKRDHPGSVAHGEQAGYRLIRDTARCLDDRAIVVTDVGQHQMRTAQAYPIRQPRQWLTSGGLGTMGFGLPVAIGAALAKPGQTVVCFTGDGSLLMNIQELATAAEEGVRVKVVLADNQALGLVHQQQDLFYAKRHTASLFQRPTDFVKIAQGFGIQACSLGQAEDRAAALAEILVRPGPGLIHCPVDVYEHVYPMVPPGAANTDMIGPYPEPRGAQR